MSRHIPSPAAETVRRLTLWPGWAACVFAIAIFILPVTVPRTLQFVPLVASAVLVGLPHGALDHLVPARMSDVSTARSMGLVSLLYAVIGGGYALVWFLAPTIGVVSFILVTLAHWGQGDVHALVTFADADHLQTRGQRVLAAIVRGGFPMLVPLVAFPTEYAQVARALVAPFAGNVAVLAPAFEVRTRAAVAVGFFTLVAVHLVWGYLRCSNGSGWRRDAGESVLLSVYFLVVPPIFAVGLYFCLWHAARHMGRLALADTVSRDRLAVGDIWGTLRRLATDTAPLTALSLLFLAGLYLLVPEPPTTLNAFVGLYLVFIAALTLPHVVVVAWMDYMDHLWSPGVSERA